MRQRIDIRSRLSLAEERCKLLVQQSPFPLAARRTLTQIPAIYVFYDRQIPVHVGRCGKLRDRMNGQCSGSVYSSSFAFKKTRERVAEKTNDKSYLRATYKSQGSRKDLFNRPYFREEFDKVIEWLRDIHLRYIQVDDDVDQYLLELVVANELHVSMDEFRTT